MKRLPRHLLLFVMFWFFAFACVTYNSYLNRSDNLNSVNSKCFIFKKVRRILSWTAFFESYDFMLPSLKEKKCEVSSCEVTRNKSATEDFDAVLLHWVDIDIHNLPKKRTGQRIILLNYESPIHVNRWRDLTKLQDIVDWTISYRLDSEIVSLYGKFVRRTDQDTKDYSLATKGLMKKSLAAWLVSNCDTSGQRRKVVDHLRQLGARIAEYGKCPTGRSGLPDKRDTAFKMLGKRYKFYLAFENSLCKDYATEKVFQPLYHGMIPIVYGGANYKKLLPNNSYIDVLDYASLEDLVENLKRIGSNEETLKKYHEWRKEFQIVEFESNNNFFCELCATLHNPELNVGKESNDLTSWWRESDCFSPIFSDGLLNIPATAKKRLELYSEGQ